MFKTFTPMYCPALREYVIFTMAGFNHLRFKVDNTPRNPKEAMYKLGLVPLIRPVIYNAKKVDNYERRYSPIGGSRKKVFAEIEYWTLVAVVGKQNTKLRIVLRRVGKGQIQFWSVMKLGENQKPPTTTDVEGT